jgi:hypothetical protein
MSTNTWTSAIPALLANGLMALRQQAVMPRLVNRAYDAEAARRGSTITVPIPSAITAIAVTNGYVSTDLTGVAPTSATITLDQWYEAAFDISDKELLNVQEGTVPMQASECIKALANNVDSYILGKYLGVYGYGGTAGTTPFGSDLGAYLNARKALANQNAPVDPRYCVIDADAEASALGLRAFQDASFGAGSALQSGQIGNKLGAAWYVDQNMPYHTAGTNSGSDVNGAHATVGTKTIAVHGGALGDFHVGDVITFSSHTQTYVVTAQTGDGTPSSIDIEPGIKEALGGTEVITTKASHRVNLLFHRDAFAFASRPLESATMGLGMFQSAVDPVSGLTLRVEISREYKQTRVSYDILYGAALVRRELAARIAG